MEGMQQLALVSSILGGFSITYVCTILTMKTEKKIEFWIFIVGLIAALCFLITTLGWSMMSFEEGKSDTFAHHQVLVKFLLVGLLTIITSISLSGWLKDTKTGISTTIIGFISLVILFTQVLSRYVNF